MKQPIGKIHGFDCYFENSSYNCPVMGLYGFSSERALSRRLAQARKTLNAQSAACKEYAATVAMKAGVTTEPKPTKQNFWNCPTCGRHFEDEDIPEDRKCPSDDCPSNESQQFELGPDQSYSGQAKRIDLKGYGGAFWLGWEGGTMAYGWPSGLICSSIKTMASMVSSPLT